MIDAEARYNPTVRHLTRYTFNAFAVLSLALCIAPGVLWVRNAWYPSLAVSDRYLPQSTGGWLTLDHATVRQRVVKALRARVPPQSTVNLVWRPAMKPPK